MTIPKKRSKTMNMRKLIQAKIESTTLYLAECLDLLKEWYHKGHGEFIDLIYIDPPFNSKRNYNVLFNSDMTEQAFKDTWSNITYLDELEQVGQMSPGLFNFLKLLETTKLPKSYISYLTMMSIRCWYMRHMLKDTGSFYYHCDPTMSHYVKIMLDYIFGAENFRNEIVWSYKTGGASKKAFAKKHDTIFFYTKSNDYTFNLQKEKSYTKAKNRKPGIINYGAGTAEFFKDENGVYNLTNMQDVWDISYINSQSKERLGYPTQKPEKLLERIIRASSNKGGLVCDFFMGGGTTIATAHKLGRVALGTDINYRAVQITKKRLEKNYLKLKKDFFILGIPRSSKELRKLVEKNELGKNKNSKFAFEDVIIKYYLHGVTGNDKQVGDNSVDGKFTFEHDKQTKTGLVQVTTGAGINHFKAFCSEIGKNKQGDMGIYITFADKVTNGMQRKAKEAGKIGNVDKIQILSVENLIDKNKTFEKPKDPNALF